jgi:hypothetical protein
MPAMAAENYQQLRDADRLRTAAHELAHAAAALEFGLEVDRVEVFGPDQFSQISGLTTLKRRAVELAKDAAPELQRSAQGVDAIIALAGHVADSYIGEDYARTDRNNARRHLGMRVTREEAKFLLTEADRVVRKYWPRICVDAAPILADCGKLNGEEVKALLQD